MAYGACPEWHLLKGFLRSNGRLKVIWGSLDFPGLDGKLRRMVKTICVLTGPAPAKFDIFVFNYLQKTVKDIA